MSQYDIHPTVGVGHIHLRVADLDRALGFYRDILGFNLHVDGRAFGLQAVFLAAGGYHHHIALNTWASAGGTPPPAGHTGLYHVAFVYPDRFELARAVERLVERDYPIDQAEDHGATVSVYLRDPDGNGVELYYDRPRGVVRRAGQPDLQGRAVRRARAAGGAELRRVARSTAGKSKG